jgi:hypothetical protein
MALENVTNELRAALEKLRAEHARISSHIGSIETILQEMGTPAKRGPGRPRGSRKAAAAPVAVKRGPGRPKGSGKKATASAANATGKRSKPNWSNEAREAARARMKAYWAARRKAG